MKTIKLTPTWTTALEIALKALAHNNSRTRIEDMRALLRPGFQALDDIIREHDGRQTITSAQRVKVFDYYAAEDIDVAEDAEVWEANGGMWVACRIWLPDD